MTSIEFKDVCFKYRTGKQVLFDINFTIDQPGLVCIIGPNGVGKSTMVKCICKIINPTKGEILVDGRSTKSMSTKQLSEFIGYVPPFSEDLFSMTVIDTILIGRHNKSKWKTSDEDLIAVHDVMKLLGIEDLAMQNFNELSAGQHQKVAIARGLVEDTDILILDEPTSNLDVRHQVYVIEMLRALAEACNKKIIMISHDLNLAAKYADTIILMSRPGVIRGIGKPEEIIAEENIKDVYGVECEIIKKNDRPLVVLGSAIPDHQVNK